MNISVMARKHGISHWTVRHRLARGWEISRALQAPLIHGRVPYSEDDNRDLRADLLAGESSARLLAERYDVSERTIFRARNRLRACGYRVRVPGDE
jgi:predicted DNA-binding transcriptional regulator YafY